MVEETEAKIVRHIYDAFLKNTPLYLIKEEARNLGFTTKGNMAIERVLKNPVYAGLLKVEAYKNYPGGLFDAIHEPIIDKTSWMMVQEKFKNPTKQRVVIDDELPLRGILKCHCGTPLSGAPSRGKSGKYFYYYKCRHSRHNNISAIKAHHQLLQICELMSLSSVQLNKIKSETNKSLEIELSNNRKKVVEKQNQLLAFQEKLFSVEEKWIKNEISKDTYQRWFSSYNDEIITLKGSIERYSTDQQIAFKILEKNLNQLTDMKFVYSKANTLQKREFVNIVFDSNLYYENGMYRTPTMMDLFSSNHLKMKEENLLIYTKKEILNNRIPFSGE
ncbi:recombinase family protein [Empedobacter brevis]|uniref:recombinase family protein n=1 Tax=Empedobacter brevis TaxID=247 RepID=UPI003340D0EA